MKVKISYYYIKSDHLLASPEFDHFEIVEVHSLYDPKLKAYISTKKDDCGHPFVEYPNSFDFDYISNAGGIKLEEYIPVVIKKL
jgi:hypothetical protein